MRSAAVDWGTTHLFGLPDPLAPLAAGLELRRPGKRNRIKTRSSIAALAAPSVPRNVLKFVLECCRGGLRGPPPAPLWRCRPQTIRQHERIEDAGRAHHARSSPVRCQESSHASWRVPSSWESAPPLGRARPVGRTPVKAIASQPDLAFGALPAPAHHTPFAQHPPLRKMSDEFTVPAVQRPLGVNAAASRQ